MRLRCPAPFLFFCALAALLPPALRAAPASDEPPAFVIQNDLVAVPAAPGALAPQLARSSDDRVYLAWIEPAGQNRHALRLARFDPAARAWGEPRTIASGAGWAVSALNLPQLAAGTGGRLTALWFLANPDSAHAPAHGNHHAVVSRSTDDGVTWTEPVPLTRESAFNEFAALQVLPDGRVLAAWLDGRNKHAGAHTGEQALYARLLDDPAAPDQLIDPRVCDCCSTALAAFPDGSAVLAYRGRGADEVRDIHTARYREGRWEKPATLNPDGWQITACPLNGPVLAARGTHLAAAWFTAAEGARVNVSVSANAGGQWLIPTRVDDVAPAGRTGLVLLDDGSQLVSWTERAGKNEAVFLRRVSPRGSLNVPVQLAPAASGLPRLVRVKDGDATPAQLLLAYTRPSTSNAQLPIVITRLVTLPDATRLAEADACECDPRPEDLRGFALKGQVVSVDATAGTVTVRHDEIPGLMKAATQSFHAAPELLAAAKPGQRFLGRIERLGADWWIFNLRTLGASP